MTRSALGGALIAALMGLSAPVGPVQAQTGVPDALSETYGDWIVRCSPDPATPDAQGATSSARLLCEMSQELWQGESGQRLLAVTLRRTDAGDQAGADEDDSGEIAGESAATGARLTILAPFGLLLGAGMQISVDGDPLLEMGFRTCLPAGCIAMAQLETATVEVMAEGAEIMVMMTAAATGEPVAIPLLTQGFAAAWTRLER